MKKIDRIKQSLDTVICTVIAVALVFTVVTVTINHIYDYSEEVAFEKLHMETQQIKMILICK